MSFITSLITSACFITNLPGPPGFFLQGSYVSIFPTSRTLCPNVDPQTDIIFYLYTSKNPETPQILQIGDNKTLSESNFDFSKPTVMYFHGFMESNVYGSAVVVRQAYIAQGTHNVIVVDAKRLLAGPWYITAAKNTLVVGKYSAKFIDYLVSQGMSLQTLNIVGHSLGGHSAGNTGSNVQSGKVPRITGLDPANPLFTNAPPETSLDPTDAVFVDIIHTDSNWNGLNRSVGHADFRPNGGVRTQPGCDLTSIWARNPFNIWELIFCNHWCSFRFYAESITKPNSFTSNPCDEGLPQPDAINPDSTYMGYGVSTSARGNYCLQTKPNSPYSEF